ncbi:hypothetical protein V6N13_121657 [Hibiscus sabdariffa]
MGKLNSSLILRSVVNAGRNLSSFHSSFSSSVNPFATRVEALSKKSISVSGKGQKDDGVETVDDALIVFNKMIGRSGWFWGLLRNNCNLKATQLLAEMVGKGFAADICTATLFVHLILGSDKSILMKV